MSPRTFAYYYYYSAQIFSLLLFCFFMRLSAVRWLALDSSSLTLFVLLHGSCLGAPGGGWGNKERHEYIYGTAVTPLMSGAHCDARKIFRYGVNSIECRGPKFSIQPGPTRLDWSNRTTGLPFLILLSCVPAGRAAGAGRESHEQIAAKREKRGNLFFSSFSRFFISSFSSCSVSSRTDRSGRRRPSLFCVQFNLEQLPPFFSSPSLVANSFLPFLFCRPVRYFQSVGAVSNKSTTRSTSARPVWAPQKSNKLTTSRMVIPTKYNIQPRPAEKRKRVNTKFPSTSSHLISFSPETDDARRIIPLNLCLTPFTFD